MPQPSLNSDNGSILTIGFLTGQDRWAIVIPFAHDDNGINRITMNEDLVHAFEALAESSLMGILAADTSLVYLQAEGMVDGSVPWREDSIPGTIPGTLGTVGMPRNVSALATYYVDPGQTLTTGRERVAKNFFAGIDASKVVGDIVDIAVRTAISTFAQAIVDGITTSAGGGKWYRVGKAVRAAAQALPNIVVVQVRDYVVTQRRRLLPRG